jgi:uncharacterized membrane protein
MNKGGGMSRNQHLLRWLPWAILSCVGWGIYGFLAKVGSAGVNATDMQILFTIGTFPLIAFFLFRRSGLGSDNKGRIIGTLIGVLAGLGGIAFFAAMERGKASLVGPTTSLFPLITVILARFALRERLNRVQMIGILLALVSAGLLAM